MAKGTLMVSSVDQTGGKIQRSYPDINVNASGSALYEFSQQLNALSTDTFVEADRLFKINLDTEDYGSGAVEKRTPTLTLGQSSVQEANVHDEVGRTEPYFYLFDITYDGDGDLRVGFENTLARTKGSSLYVDAGFRILEVNGAPKLGVLVNNRLEGENASVTVFAEETATCERVSTTFTVIAD